VWELVGRLGPEKSLAFDHNGEDALDAAHHLGGAVEVPSRHPTSVLGECSKSCELHGSGTMGIVPSLEAPSRVGSCRRVTPGLVGSLGGGAAAGGACRLR
jgi:hypothetical protein